MCFGFGDMKTTETKNEQKSIPAWLTADTQENIGNLRGLRDNGYQAYGGPRVADLSGDEGNAFSLIRSLAGSSNPYTADSAAAFKGVAGTPAAQVSTSRLIDDVPGAGGGGSTADYMNPFISSVLAPQLRDIDRQTMQRQKQMNARSTSSGAFGDARTGIEAAFNSDLGDRRRIDTVGKGYSDAFASALGMKGIDLSRALDVSKTNASLGEQSLLRQLQGGTALQNLDRYNTGRTADLATMEAGAGNTQRGVEQAKLDAPFQEFLRSQQFPLLIQQLLNSAINSAQHDTGTFTETQKPDNTGYALLGKGLGVAANFL